MGNKIYFNEEDVVSFGDNGNVTMTLAGLASGEGRVSNQKTLSAVPRGYRYKWMSKFKFATTPVVGESLQIYLSNETDGFQDGSLGSSDASMTISSLLNNLQFLGSVVVDTATTAVTFVASGVTEIFADKVSVVVWNDTADALTTGTSDHEVRLIPIPDEIQ